MFCWKFSALCSSERILQIDQELTKLRPWLGWHPYLTYNVDPHRELKPLIIHFAGQLGGLEDYMSCEKDNSKLWVVITLQTLWWNIVAESRS